MGVLDVWRRACTVATVITTSNERKVTYLSTVFYRLRMLLLQRAFWPSGVGAGKWILQARAPSFHAWTACRVPNASIGARPIRLIASNGRRPSPCSTSRELRLEEA